MNTEPHVLHFEEPIRDAIELMETGRYRNVPIVDERRVLHGIVRPQDVLRYLAEAFPEEVLNLPPRPHQRMKESEGRVTTAEHRLANPGARPRHDPVRRRFRRRHAAHRHPVHPDGRAVRQRHQHVPGLPGRDPRPGRLPARRVSGFQLSFSQHRHPHPRRRAGRARGDEPGRAQGEPRRPAGRRRPHRQRGRVHDRTT